MVRTIAGEHHWPLSEILQLYLDEEDNEGLIFWYNDVKDTVQRLKSASGNK